MGGARRSARAGVKPPARFDLPRPPPYVRRMTAIEERRLKVLLKNAVTEVLEERQDLLQAALQESLEDMAMLKATQDGEKSRLTTRKKIFHQLDRAA